MNPFVNPNKRDVTLPPGCKDLMDVLKQSKDWVDVADKDPGQASWAATMMALHASDKYWKDFLKQSKEWAGVLDIDFGKADCATAMMPVDPAMVARTFIGLFLFQAQQDNVTELVIGINSSEEKTPIQEKINNAWCKSSFFPAQFRPKLIDALMRLANLPPGQFPCEGIFSLKMGNARIRWAIRIETAEGECQLTRVVE
jgi:hypothetical protein